MKREDALKTVKAGTMTNDELLVFAKQSGDPYIWEAAANHLNLTNLTKKELLDLRGKTYNQYVWKVIDSVLK